MNKYESFFLDLDGTLIDSLGVKNRVFIEVLETEGIPANFSENLIRESISLTRRERFNNIWRDFHGVGIPSEILSCLLERSERALLESPIVPLPGVELFLAEFSHKSTLHVVSAASQIEIIRIFEGLGWTDYFETVNSEVSNKARVFDELKKNFLYASNSCLSVGDTQSDCYSAIKSKIEYWKILSGLDSILEQSEYLVGSSPDFYGLLNHLK